MLLNHGANINEVDDYGNTALHAAVLKGHVPLVRLLCDRYCDVNILNQVITTTPPSTAKGKGLFKTHSFLSLFREVKRRYTSQVKLEITIF